ncbi:hypothetical protein CIL05_05635 [Virgibacillus profundi]|uniref:Peptidylprolyl isomerase n=1 Tax=Virgibacillus profundi TaxID=2024555 RepID=A0A2A2IHL0_9BACI|nr:SurA N-terminal domain-containing protein [Virgibacillus profundi]PAV30583.1 hypothetical protein CIL05_05635 [Virgibacillus profundi]PXY54755.1 hypothetical protein CIT14_05720 [Virgibacillus profundi]
MKKFIMLALALSLAIVLAACADDSAEENEGSEETEENTSEQEQEPSSEQAQEPEPVEITDEEKVDEEAAVVSVNGDEIKGNKYNPIYSQLKMTMQQSGQDTSNLDQLKEQTINVLIEQQLIKQAAEDKGLEVTEEEVQSEFTTLKEENGEQLSAVLEQFQLTEENFKNQLADDLITQKFIDSELDTEVTDEEIKETYDQLKEQNEEIGELETVEPQLKQSLKNQKVQEQLQVKVKELRENAEVETLI